MTEQRAIGVEEASAIAGVSVDSIRRAYRAGRLRAYRPAGQRKVVIRREDLEAWAFGDEQLVVAPAGTRLRPIDDLEAPQRASANGSRRRPAAGSVDRLLEIERRG